ncbi:sushi, von Willebrand factor type A, EGF and pentraxin domain-containing protein 1-like [Lingula anatina]|uniref:Sushi, von Willebrand factor type A, EGF and pentraxin domain-containing protein 1-like n=1 Tax=Lingula anatina TaxID=7574 RepID=A0A1S3IV79_LINAN|nr:sushi, von Willebrand factor type A, EGF and pentraxin domain-containing protein 1-like [Lingula anatina]|eukprot:XP_013402105.1 sushi, von Willebrand factor type A, EGF and pentraxin domain-containing protein 1-like [Lingula anatina]
MYLKWRRPWGESRDVEKAAGRCKSVGKAAGRGRDVEKAVGRGRDVEKTVQLNMTFIFTPRNISDTDYQSMHTFVLTIFNTGGAPANPVKQLTGPAGCATVTAKLSTVRDNFMDYRCLSNSKVRYQTDDNICLECPSGQYRSGGMCHLCPLGTYQDMQDQTSCTQCPAGTWTYSMGSNKRQDCRATCGNAAGFMSDTRLPPCMECPVNSYSVNSTYCEQCPGGTVTHGTGKDNVTDCELACPLGYYSFDGFFPCQACPRGFYQDTKQSLSCQECPANTTTLMTAATHLDNCTDIATTVCTNTTCANMGTCYPQGHTYYCMCPAGYTGRHCEVMINHCDSMPCHYGAQCTPVVDGFTCNCSTPNKAGETTYTGLRCENETSQCSNGTGFPIHDCKNDAMCQDLEAGFNCLCLSTGSFTGDKCETTRNICLEEQCQNGAACMPIGATAIRRECLCRPGYTGYECETMIDYCLSNPCQHLI